MRHDSASARQQLKSSVDAEFHRLREELAKARQRERDLEETRRAMLNLLEDLEEHRLEIDRARREWSSVFDRIRDVMFMHDAEYRVFRANRAYAEAAGMEPEEFIGRPYWEVFPKGDGPLAECKRAMEGTRLMDVVTEEEVVLPNGQIFRSRSFPLGDAHGNYQFSVHIMEDITERHHSEMALRRLSAALCQAGEGIVVCDRDLSISYVNTAMGTLAGWDPAHLVGQNPMVLLAPEYAGCMQQIREEVGRGNGWSGELEILAVDGGRIPVRLSTSPIHDPGDAVAGWVGVFTDLREIKRKEQALRKLNRALETLSAANALLVRAHDETVLAQQVCQVLVTMGGFRMAWIGEAERDEAKTVRPVAWAGHELGFLDSLRISWDDAARGPTSTAIRDGRPVLSNDLENDLAFSPWRDAALARGYRSAIVLPLCVRGQCTGAIHIYAGELNAFDQDEVKLLLELADDVAFGIAAVRERHNRIKAERALRASEQRLRTIIDNEAEGIVVVDANRRILFVNRAAEGILGRKRRSLSGTTFSFPAPSGKPVEMEIARPDGTTATVEVRFIRTEWFGQPASIVSLQDITERKNLEEERLRNAAALQSRLVETIEAMGMAVEKRDPYTAGHQRRVANLVQAIGWELGLDQDRVEGMRLGATIHDIGKMFVPAEILNRPGQLSKIEYAIVLTHPQAGYDIVKGIEFPWPVAEMILQHHERLDGSGYPHGLKGDQIYLEARVLAVADVVEAIASHRPYRPSLGLKAALNEIIRNRGILYDPDVVDACVRVLEEKGYERAVS